MPKDPNVTWTTQELLEAGQFLYHIREHSFPDPTQRRVLSIALAVVDDVRVGNLVRAATRKDA